MWLAPPSSPHPPLRSRELAGAISGRRRRRKGCTAYGRPSFSPTISYRRCSHPRLLPTSTACCDTDDDDAPPATDGATRDEETTGYARFCSTTQRLRRRHRRRRRTGEETKTTQSASAHGRRRARARETRRRGREETSARVRKITHNGLTGRVSENRPVKPCYTPIPVLI